MKADPSRHPGNEDLGFLHRFEPGTSGDTVLLLHGTGGDEGDLLSIGRRIAPDASLLSPRGQALANAMPRFFRRLEVGGFDVEALVRRAGGLGRFARWA